MKRILSCLLVLVLLVTMLPVGALAAALNSTGGKLIAITFDDGPGQYTDKLIDGLNKLGAKATFFMVGRSVSGYSDTVRKAYLSGHQIGCHSWDHPELTSLSSSAVEKQFSKSYEAMDKICGEGTYYITRAPYGSSNSRVRSVVDTPFIDWSVDPMDWDVLNAEKVKNHIVKYAQDGAIVLVHDIYNSSVNGALAAVEILMKQGYEFVTINELYRRRGVTLEDQKVYYKCSPNGTDKGSVQTPVITYTADSKGLLVTITAQSGADIYYNTDGSGIDQESKKYTKPFYVDSGTTVYAVAAFDLNGSRSDVAKQKVTKAWCAAPEMVIDENGVMTLSCKTAGAQIRYSTTGTASMNSIRYTGPVTLEPGTVVSAVAGGDLFFTSGETRMYYSLRGNVFTDVFPDSWFCDLIDQAVEEKLLNGVGGCAYEPRASVTRAQFVTLLYRFAGYPDPLEGAAEYPFADVPENSYYADAVQWAYENGVIHGYSDEVFAPQEKIARDQICLIIDNFLTSQGTPLPEGTGKINAFSDAAQVRGYARDAVDAMMEAGLLNGSTDGKVLPRDHATRAEAVALLMRMRDYADSYVVPEPPAPEEPEPAEPEGPEDPTEPSDPAEPTEQEEPSEPAEPTEPEEPSEPAEPVEPSDPQEP